MNTQRTRKSNRSNKAQRTQGLHPGVRQAMKLLNQSVALVRGPVDPAPIDNTIKITKRVELVTVPATALNVNAAMLFTALQGSSTFFDALRIQKISAYDDSAAGSFVQVSFPGQDGANYIDRGTMGQKRAQVHLSPSFEQRATWLGPAVVGSQFAVTTTNAGVIQVTVEARTSTAGDS